MKQLIVCVLLFLAACRDERPPAPSAEQSEQLNNAEDMLDNMTTNEEGPADRSTGPSNQSN